VQCLHSMVEYMGEIYMSVNPEMFSYVSTKFYGRHFTLVL